MSTAGFHIHLPSYLGSFMTYITFGGPCWT